MGEEKIQLETLVKRLFIIDSKLTSENAQLVSEYNQIVEEIYAAISKIRTDNEKSMVLSKKKYEVRNNGDSEDIARDSKRA